MKKYLLLLFLICSILVYKNYIPGTWLTGWDTLHPELNFPLNFSRLFSGVWRSEQGLGAVAGHSHMADLPRVIILWLFSFFLPQNALRYSYIFVCLIAGTFGFLVLAKYLFKKPSLAFLSSLAYLCNLSTIQQFYVPFEMFPTQWAYIPWLFLWIIKSFHTHQKKYFVYFALTTLLATPSAYAAQLWYVYFAFILTYCLGYLALNFSKLNLKTFLKIIFITLSVNSFWLLPNLYFIKNESDSPRYYQNNRLYSQEFLAQNRQTGNLEDVGLTKGFYFNWEIYNFENKKSENLMPVWNTHLQNTDIKLIGYTVFILSILGLLFSLLKLQKDLIPLIVPFLGLLVVIGNTLPICKQIFNWLLSFAILDEALRFVFSKTSIIFSFILVLFFTNTISYFYDRLAIRFKKVLFLTATSCLLFYIAPAFTGQLIEPKLKLNIPTSYFNFWDFMKTQDPEGRVLTLPLHDPAGWQYYSWGYQGSGFIWFNLNQPVLDRDFDRWNQKNEASYQEAYYALYKNDPQVFAQVLQKYNIKYIVWDESLTTTQEKNQSQLTYYNGIQQLLEKLENQGLVIKLNTFGTIQVLENLQYQPARLSILNTNVPKYYTNYTDHSFAKFGNYLSSSSPEQTTLQNAVSKNGKLSPEFIEKLSNPVKQTSLFTDKVLAQVFLRRLNDTTAELKITPLLSDSLISYLTTIFTVAIPKDSTYSTFNNNILFFDRQYQGLQEISTQNNFFNDTQTINLNFSNLDGESISLVSQTPLIKHKQPISFSSIKKTDSKSFYYDYLSQSTGYIVGVNSSHLSGFPLRLCIKDTNSGNCFVYDEMEKHSASGWDYFLLPPYGNNLGYEFILLNISNTTAPSQNIIEELSITPLPIDWIQNLDLSSTQLSTPKIIATNWQAYNSGWQAYFYQNGQRIYLKNHQILNNWANSWDLPQNHNNQKVYFEFLPQSLQNFGFGLIFLCFSILSFSYTKQHKK